MVKTVTVNNREQREKAAEWTCPWLSAVRGGYGSRRQSEGMLDSGGYKEVSSCGAGRARRGGLEMYEYLGVGPKGAWWLHGL